MKLSRKDFLNYAGIKSNANFSQYVTRGKITVEPDGSIDLELKQNKEWLKSRASKGLCPDFTATVLGVAPEVTPKPTGKRLALSAERAVEPIELNRSNKKKVENAVTSRYEIELEKLKAELEKKLVDTELAREKLDTIKGNNIPVSIVKEIMSALSRSIINNYKSFSEQQISEICHKHRIDESMRVKLVAQNVSGLNKIHEKAIGDAKHQFKAIVGMNKEKQSFENDESDE